MNDISFVPSFNSTMKLRLRRTLVHLVILCSFFITAYAQQATWIWYPSDYEIWLGNQMQNRRTERGAFLPHFRKIDKEIEIAVGGTFNIKLNGGQNALSNIN